MRQSSRFLVAFAALGLALSAVASGCELIVGIDPKEISTTGTGGSSSHSASSSHASSGTGGSGGSGGGTTTGTGGTAGASSSTGTGGSGCTTDGDCPPTNDPCSDPSCDTTTHECKVIPRADGDLAADSVQTASDCKKVICQADGTTKGVPDDTDVADDGEVCTTDTCVDGVETHTPTAGPCSENMGTVCGDPANTDPKVPGTCVICNVDADCSSGVCKLNLCVTSDCNDQVQDDQETDVDCGGGCPPCDNNLKCQKDSDCQGGNCNQATHTCTAPSCIDGALNQGETDTDCGGAVCRVEGKLCGTGKKCVIAGDCQSKNCDTVNHVCRAATCVDLIQNQGETDKDCGGPNCSPCQDTQKCSKGTDCVNKICDPTAKTCTPASCTDTVFNGLETDLDCGGSLCDMQGKLCGTGKTCGIPADCLSLNCIGSKCLAPTCVDNIQNQGETDKDCGGTVCDAQGIFCADGLKCAANGDCQNKICTGNICQGALCTDGVQNGVETDQDCGGAVCDNNGHKCADTLKCLVNADCQSGVCLNKVCQVPTCVDNTLNGLETDKDCGGTLCDGNGHKCADGLKCLVPADCVSGVCTGNVCQVPACNDNTQNGLETDKDCGGALCGATCMTGQKCLATTDCLAPGGCDKTTHTCDATTCNDGIVSGNETDQDCGGGVCPGCATTKACLQNSDCVSADGCDKTTKKCVVGFCSDGIKNLTETDIDCGGSCATKCATNSACLVNADCVAADGCDFNTKKCVVGFCSDGLKSTGETDVDCGGTTCTARCTTTQGCATNSDCIPTDGCDFATKKCVVGFCTDGLKNGNETGPDCGGTTCTARCANGVGCAADSDCQSGACDLVTGKCATSQCADERKDGTETDVDCGGPCTTKCANGLGCAANADCQSGACDLVTGKCATSQCADERKDGTETDVDCGGSCTTKCANGLGCAADTDCQSGACDLVTSKCATSQCSDERQDGMETDKDCGGGTCGACADGLGCEVDSDCQSGACDLVTFVCATSECTDQRKDGDETDVDCGGGTCGACADGLGCAADSDCTSDACDLVTSTCATSKCTDQRKDSTETGVDCGGPCTTKCANGVGCLVGGDCTSTHCLGAAHVCVECINNGDCASHNCNTTTNVCQ